MHTQELRRRIGKHFLLKGVGSTLAISLFFVAYFFVLHHPLFSVRMVPLLHLDRWIPVLPWTVWVYFSLWVYICLPQALMGEVRPMGHYLLGAFVLAGMGLAIFMFWPTAVPEWEINWSDYRFLAFLKEADASGNACPSLHVAFAVFSGLWLNMVLLGLEAGRALRWISFLWCLAIIISTATTKQHLVIDIVSGAVLGGLVFALNRAWLMRRHVEL